MGWGQDQEKMSTKYIEGEEEIFLKIPKERQLSEKCFKSRQEKEIRHEVG